MTDDPVITVAEAAELLNVHKQTVRKYCKDGKLRYAQPGRKILIRRSWVEECLARQNAEPLGA